jgi:hypothetical protein
MGRLHNDECPLFYRFGALFTGLGEEWGMIVDLSCPVSKPISQTFDLHPIISGFKVTVTGLWIRNAIEGQIVGNFGLRAIVWTKRRGTNPPRPLQVGEDETGEGRNWNLLQNLSVF